MSRRAKKSLKFDVNTSGGALQNRHNLTSIPPEGPLKNSNAVIFVCSPQAKKINPFFHSFSRFFRPGKLSPLCEHDVKSKKKFAFGEIFGQNFGIFTSNFGIFTSPDTPPSIPGSPKICNICLGHYLELSTPLWVHQEKKSKTRFGNPLFFPAPGKNPGLLPDHVPDCQQAPKSQNFSPSGGPK